jgi:homoserine kinase
MSGPDQNDDGWRGDDASEAPAWNSLESAMTAAGLARDVSRAGAFAPASVGNVAVGFDVLGHSVSVLGDTVQAVRTATRGVKIREITGVAADLPTDAARNTAGIAVSALLAAAGVSHGVELTLKKGIPPGSGLGGSAASAVAAVVAANALLAKPLDKLQLLKCAMRGETAASGTIHVDNVAASLYGGLVLIVGIDDPIVTQIPVPPSVRCVLVHPHLELTTRAARQVLHRMVSLSDVTWQQANLAGFVAGCFTNDLALMRASLLDVLIEPQRKVLIPGFEQAKSAAMDNGAIGCSISGAGPTVFAWVEAPHAERVLGGLVDAFASAGLATDRWVTPIEPAGARVLETE